MQDFATIHRMMMVIWLEFINPLLLGGFKHCLFSPIVWMMIQSDELHHFIFCQVGQPPTRLVLHLGKCGKHIMGSSHGASKRRRIRCTEIFPAIGLRGHRAVPACGSGLAGSGLGPSRGIQRSTIRRFSMGKCGKHHLTGA